MPNSNDRHRRPIGRPKTDPTRRTEVSLRTIPTRDSPKLAGDLSLADGSLASAIEREDHELIVGALARAVAISDQYDPRRNPGRSMRQLRSLFASSRLRAALRRFDAERLPFE
jgi:hypothetical protein